MPGRRVVALGLVLLSLGIAATALLGPLATDTIDYRFSENMERQTTGGDAFLLFVVVPALLYAARLWFRGDRLAPFLACSAATFTSYTFLGFILIPNYNQYEGNNENYYPLFVAVLAVGLGLSAASWAAAGQTPIPAPSRRLLRITAGVLLFTSIAVGLTWSRQIADVMAGEYTLEYREHPAAFWLIRTLDFAIIIPVAIATAVGLLSGRPMANRAALAIAGFLTLIAGSIGAMTLVLVIEDDPTADAGGLIAFGIVTAGFALLTWKLWKPVDRSGDAHAAGHPTPIRPTPQRW